MKNMCILTVEPMRIRGNYYESDFFRVTKIKFKPWQRYLSHHILED